MKITKYNVPFFRLKVKHTIHFPHLQRTAIDYIFLGKITDRTIEAAKANMIIPKEIREEI